MKPTLGATVIYKLSEQDAEDINRRRGDADEFRRTLPRTEAIRSGSRGRSGHVMHFGNPAAAGDEHPAQVVRLPSPEWAEQTAVNLQVHLDGNDLHWAPSRGQGTGHGEWQWPAQPEQENADETASHVPHVGPEGE
ncbi:MAG TPA: hypothetical protein VGG54_22845 [Trebonia sp.]|jgi:hypothetical protein